MTASRMMLPLLPIRRSTVRLILLLLFFVVYLVIGATIFSSIESPQEAAWAKGLRTKRKDFLADNPCVSDSDLEDLIETILAAANRGVSASKNASGEPNWSFGQSLFFSTTVVTTIGYGHVTPLSEEGKIFCIIYAIIGIPLTLMLLTALVERLMIPSTKVLQCLNSKLGHLYSAFNIRLIHLVLVFLLFLIFFMLIPAAVFAHFEKDWNYMDSLYYCFISLTTIGLGDYIPGDNHNQPYRPFYKIFTTGYLLAGLTFLVFLLAVFNEIPQLNFGLFFLMQSDEASDMSIDPEKVRLQTPNTLPKYSGSFDGPRHSVVRVKTRRVDSPSPEDTTPVHALQ